MVFRKSSWESWVLNGLVRQRKVCSRRLRQALTKNLRNWTATLTLSLFCKSMLRDELLIKFRPSIHSLIKICTRQNWRLSALTLKTSFTKDSSAISGKSRLSTSWKTPPKSTTNVLSTLCCKWASSTRRAPLTRTSFSLSCGRTWVSPKILKPALSKRKPLWNILKHTCAQSRTLFSLGSLRLKLKIRSPSWLESSSSLFTKAPSDCTKTAKTSSWRPRTSTTSR